MIISDSGRCSTASKIQRSMKKRRKRRRQSRITQRCGMGERKNGQLNQKVDSQSNISEAGSLDYSYRTGALWIPKKSQLWSVKPNPAKLWIIARINCDKPFPIAIFSGSLLCREVEIASIISLRTSRIE